MHNACNTVATSFIYMYFNMYSAHFNPEKTHEFTPLHLRDSDAKGVLVDAVDG